MLPDLGTSGTAPGTLRLNAPSGAGCSLTLLLGAAWLQRFQGLDRHRPSGALPEVAGTGPFLPPFVGMTPLATDGPGSGSGAGSGRDHAEKWQSRGVSHTTLMVTKTTKSAGLNPVSTRTRVLFLTRSPPAQAPSSSASTAPPMPVPHRTRIFPYPPHQGTEPHPLPHRTRTIRRTTSLDSSTQHPNKPSLWTHLPGADQTTGETPPNMAQRRPPDHCPVPPLALPHEQNNSTRPPPTPAQSGDTLFPTTRSRSVHAVHDRVPAGASHGHPFSRRTSTVLSTNKYRSRERGAGAGGRDSPRAHATGRPGPGEPPAAWAPSWGS